MPALKRKIATRLRRWANLLDKSPKRDPFKPGELAELMSHLAYEWLMFDYTSKTWKTNRQRYVLEALLLHCRNLRDFLFGQIENYGRDADKAVIAKDYAPKWDADKGNHKYQILWKTDAAINAQLAHLSRKRADSNAQRALDDEADQIVTAVTKAWESFRQALTSTSWSDQLDSAIATKRAELGIE